MEEWKMPRKEVTNEELYAKLEEIRQLLSTQLSMFKLVNAKAIENSRAKILELEIRKKIFDSCDNKKTVTQITQTVFPNEPLDKAQPKVSYHLAILEDYGLVGCRDDRGQRYYFKKRD
jgi:DNA-binding transcriptional ArsR family regulator